MRKVGAPLSHGLDVWLANTWWSRFVGLLRFKSLGVNEALLLQPGGSIHTCWMRFAIDIVFLDQNGCIVKICPDVKPFRARLAPPNTGSVLELSARKSAALGLKIGDQLTLCEL